MPVTRALSAGGLYDPAAESARADKVMAEKFAQSQQQLLITVTAPNGGIDGAAREVGMRIVDQLARSPHVAGVISAWTVPPGDAMRLISKDHTSGLIVASINGDENDAPQYAHELSDRLVYDRNGVTVRSGGATMLSSQVTEKKFHATGNRGPGFGGLSGFGLVFRGSQVAPGARAVSAFGSSL